MRKEAQIQCATPTLNLSLYHTQPERHRRPQTLERLTMDWTRHRSAGLRHGVRSSEHSQRHRNAGLRHGVVLNPTQSPAGVRIDIDQPESGGGSPQSKTCRKQDAPRPSRSVVEAPSSRLLRDYGVPRCVRCCAALAADHEPDGKWVFEAGGRTRIARPSRPGERQTWSTSNNQLSTLN